MKYGEEYKGACRRLLYHLYRCGYAPVQTDKGTMIEQRDYLKPGRSKGTSGRCLGITVNAHLGAERWTVKKDNWLYYRNLAVTGDQRQHFTMLQFQMQCKKVLKCRTPGLCRIFWIYERRTQQVGDRPLVAFAFYGFDTQGGLFYEIPESTHPEIQSDLERAFFDDVLSLALSEML